MGADNKQSKMYCAIIINTMRLYSESTISKVADLCESEKEMATISRLLEKKLPEQEFLKKISTQLKRKQLCDIISSRT